MTARDVSADHVPDEPVLTVILHPDGTATINGEPVRRKGPDSAKTRALARATVHAARLGRPVRVRAHDHEGWHDVVAYPNGNTTELERNRRPGPRTLLGRLPRLTRTTGSPRTTGPTRRRHRVGPAASPAAASPSDRARDVPGTATRAATGPVGDTSRRTWYSEPETPTRPRDRAADSSPSRPGLAPRPDPDPSSGQSSTAAGRPEQVAWPAPEQARPRRKLASTRTVLVLTGIVIVSVVGLQFRSRTQAAQPPATTAAVPSSALALPPGFDRPPVWSIPVAGWTTSSATDDGTVLTRDPVGHVLLLDPATGRTLWRSSDATDADQAGPWPSSVDGVPVAVVTGTGRMTYWDLPAPSSPSGGGVGSPGRTFTVPLPAGATVSSAGASPLVQLSDQQAAVIRSGALVPVPLPVGARGLAADGDLVLAVTPTGWLRQQAGQAPQAPRPVPRPPNAGSAPLRLEAVGTTMLLAIWPRTTGPGQIVALTDTRVDRNVITTTLTSAADLRRFEAVREVGGTQVAVGPVVVDTYAAKLDVLDVRYVVKGLTRGHAWTMFNGRATDLHLSADGSFATVAFGAGAPTLPVGVSQDGSSPRAVVIEPTATGWALCGLAAE